MEVYKNVNGDSSVLSYKLGNSYIDVKFNYTPIIYRYSYRTAGEEHVERMKQLATLGRGLNSYIKSCVYDKYEK